MRLFVLVLVLLLVPVVYAAPAQKMPDLSQYVVDDQNTIYITCPPDKVVKRKNYDEKDGVNDDYYELLAFFFFGQRQTVVDESAPFLVLTWEDNPEGPPLLWVDRDRDGMVDKKGHLGEPGFEGREVCDYLP